MTNKRVVIVQEKGIFKKTINTFEERIDKIKIYQGRPQVNAQSQGFLEGTDVEVYFFDGLLKLSFSSEEKKRAKDFIFEINKLLGDPEISGEQGEDSNKIFSIPGSEKIAKALKGTFSTFKDTFSDQQKKSNNCINCGGQVTGVVGKTAKCPFCGNVMEIK